METKEVKKYWQVHSEINTGLIIAYGCYDDLQKALGVALKNAYASIISCGLDENETLSLLMTENLEGDNGYSLQIMSTNLEAPDKMFEENGMACIEQYFILEVSEEYNV